MDRGSNVFVLVFCLIVMIFDVVWLEKNGVLLDVECFGYVLNCIVWFVFYIFVVSGL